MSKVDDATSHEEMIDVPEVAVRLGVSRDTVYRHVRAGELPHYKFGPQLRFLWSEVQAALRTRQSKAGAR